MSSSTQVIITFQTKPESIQAFTDILQQVQHDLPQVAGCTSVRCFAAVYEPTTFTLVEDWESEALHQQHIERVVASGAWASIASHLAAEPVSAYYTQL